MNTIGLEGTSGHESLRHTTAHLNFSESLRGDTSKSFVGRFKSYKMSKIFQLCARQKVFVSSLFNVLCFGLVAIAVTLFTALYLGDIR